MAGIESTTPSKTCAALLRISSLARMGSIYAKFSEAELVGIETVLEMIEQLATEQLAEMEN